MNIMTMITEHILIWGVWFIESAGRFLSIYQREGFSSQAIAILLISVGCAILIVLVTTIIFMAQDDFGDSTPENAVKPQPSKRKKQKELNETSENSAPAQNGATPAHFQQIDPPVTAEDARTIELQRIEREMQSLKELYQSGHISIESYISKSKVLFHTAQSLTIS